MEDAGIEATDDLQESNYIARLLSSIFVQEMLLPSFLQQTAGTVKLIFNQNKDEYNSEFLESTWIKGVRQNSC